MHSKPPRAWRILRVRVRRLMARFDRRAALLLAWVPTWGTSVLLHVALIMLLGLYVYARSSWGQRDNRFDATFHPAAGLRDNVVSLTPSDHAGDPFTHERKADSPSIPFERADPEVTLVAQPEIPRLAHFAPVIAGPEPGASPLNTMPGPKGRGTGKGGTIAPQTHSEDISAPFSGRSPDMKAMLLRREGGTAQSEMAVDAGLDWLARHQKIDGGWSLNFQSECRGDACPTVLPALESDTAATGLALLPLLGAGHIHTVKSRYQANIRRGLDWLIEHQDGSGNLYVGGARNAHLYSHAIATMALCEAYGLSQDERLREPATRAIRFIIDAQNTQTGGWRYHPGDTGDTSVLGWQMFALRSARLAGLQIPRNVLKGVKTYLDDAADSGKVTYAYQPGRGGTYVMTAEALLVRQYLGWPRDFPPLVKGVAHVAEHLKESPERNIYYWYYATQLLHNMQNREWPRWNVKLREALIRTQLTGGGCDRGSWDPLQPQPDTWGRSAGRLYETALSLLTLEVYYRYLPLYRPSDADPPDKQPDAAGKPAGGFQPVPAPR